MVWVVHILKDCFIPSLVFRQICQVERFVESCIECGPFLVDLEITVWIIPQKIQLLVACQLVNSHFVYSHFVYSHFVYSQLVNSSIYGQIANYY